MQTFTDLCKHVFTDVTGYKSMHANQNPSPHLKATEFLQIHVFFLLPLLIVVFAALQSNSCFFLKLALIFVHFFPSPRVRRLASTWTQSSTSSARRSIRRTWKTFSERQRRGLWPSTENRGITRGRRNVSFCESFFFKKRTKSHKNPLLQWDRLCSVSCRDWKLGACTWSFSVTRKWVMTQQERQFCKLQRGAWNTLFWRVLLSYVMSGIFMYFLLPEEFCTVSTFVLLFYQKHIYWRHRVIVCIVM